MHSVRKWEIGTSGKNLGMTRQQIHMEKDECMLAHITHQTGREHPQSLQTNTHGPESWSQTPPSPGAPPSQKCSNISYGTPCSETRLRIVGKEGGGVAWPGLGRKCTTGKAVRFRTLGVWESWDTGYRSRVLLKVTG